MMKQVVRGCDTFVAFHPFASQGTVIFGKNSDRPAGEGQTLRKYPASHHGANASLPCTYLTIPQSTETFAVMVSQIDWMWGCEHGANEFGVVIGNEAVWTRVQAESDRLLGMDLVRLGLERSKTAREALGTITSLLEEFGQGGACAENDPEFTYDNAFLIADFNEAWLLETAGRHWVAVRVKDAQNISNQLSIRTEYDLSSIGLLDYARENGFWNADEPFDFAACFSEGGAIETSRKTCGRHLLHHHKDKETLDPQAMMEILRDHNSAICMHGAVETTASMVSELREGGARHWTTGPYPCQTMYVEEQLQTEAAKV